MEAAASLRRVPISWMQLHHPSIPCPSLVFEGLKVSGSLEVCCGEMYYRLGMYEEVRRIGEKLRNYYSRFDVERIVFICPACLNMFENVYPEGFGIYFNFEKVSLWRWLLEHKNEFDFKPLGVSVAMHDSCHGRMLGESFQREVREVLRLCGVQVEEGVEALNLGYCCGIGAATVRLSLLDIVKTGVKALRAARKARASELATYCGGCLLTLSAIKLLTPIRLPVHHALEYVIASMGGNVPSKHSRQAAKMVYGLLLNVTPKYLSRKRFKVAENLTGIVLV